MTMLLVLNRLFKQKAKKRKMHEPHHDKTNKMNCAASKDSDQPRHSPSLVRVRCPHEIAMGP